MRLEPVTAATTEPVSLADAKLWLRVDHDAEDALIDALISATRQYCEEYTGTALVASAWRLSVRPDAPDFLFPLELPRPPLAILTGVSAVMEDGTAETLLVMDWLVLGIHPASVQPRPGTWSPYATAELRFDYTVGPAGPVPARALQAMRLLMAHWYENRVAATVSRAELREPPHSVTALLDGLRLVRI